MKYAKSVAGLLAVWMVLAVMRPLTGCSRMPADNAASQNTTVSGTVNSAGSLNDAQINPLDYVDLGDYTHIEIQVDGLDLYVGEVSVNIPYRDEGFGTEWTLQYYYSQTNPTEDKAGWVIPTDEAVTKMGIPGISSFRELKDYVLQKVNENDEITSFMLIGDAVMEQIVAGSTFEKLPENAALAWEGIYTDYLEKMLARCNKIGVLPSVQKGEDSARKVLAAMAIAQETGMGTDSFDYEEILKYLIGEANQ